MIVLNVNGKNKIKRDVAEQAVIILLKKLLPKMQNMVLDVDLKKVKHSVGNVVQLDKRHFHVKIDKRMGVYDMVVALAHEMVHVKQFVRNEFKNVGFKLYWKGEDFSDAGYFDQPWEREAYERQEDLAEMVMKELMGK